jgi:hypothetical protein
MLKLPGYSLKVLTVVAQLKKEKEAVLRIPPTVDSYFKL